MERVPKNNARGAIEQGRVGGRELSSGQGAQHDINDSPLMVAQREKLQNIFGGMVQGPKTGPGTPMIPASGHRMAGGSVSRGAEGAGSISTSTWVTQCARTHDYNDAVIRGLGLTATESSNIQQRLDALNLTYTLPQGVTQQNISQMGIKGQIRTAIQSEKPNVGNNILGVSNTLGVGVHIIRVWDNSNPVNEIFHFQVTVIPHGGAAVDAAAEDLNWQNAVAALTYDDAAARTFKDNHTVDQVPTSSEEHMLALVAIGRQKASTLIELTTQAKDDLVQEVRGHMQTGDYTAKKHFVTTASYPMLDIDPLVDPPELKFFDATFEYDVFHNPNNSFWQISHFHGAVAKSNERTISAGTSGIKGAVTKLGTTLTLTGITGQMNAGTHSITITSSDAVDVVRVQIDDGTWKAAEQNSADPFTWTYAWQASRGNHTIRAEGQAKKGQRTKIASRATKVT